MVEFDRTLEREPGVAENLKICVVGVGGAGLNVLDRISLDRMLDATIVAMHTDVRVLTHSMSASKIQLGVDVMRGIGSGGDPELGREAATASREKIRSVIQGHNMVFICCGLGGGTGSGAAPIVARLAKETGALVFVFATTPFVFEGRRRLLQAESAMAELQKHADALILFENNRMGELVLPKEGIQKAFSQADQLIGHSVRAIATMVTQPGIVRMGLADLMAALNSPNARCLFGFGEARGSNRVTEALKRSLKSPLVNQGQLLQNARNLLVHVAGGESLTLSEVEALMKQLGKCVPESTQIMFGLAVDSRMGDAISVTLVSSLSAQEMTSAMAQGDESTEEPAATKAVEGQKMETVSPVVETKQAPVVDHDNQPEEAEVAALTPKTVVEVHKMQPPPPPLEPVVAKQTPASPERDLFGEEVPVVAPSESTNESKAQVRIVIPQQQPETMGEKEDAAPAPAAPVVAKEPEAPQIAEPVLSSKPEIVDAPEMAPAPKSIFSVIDSSDDDDDEIVDESDDVHWADKYIQPSTPAVAAAEPRVREAAIAAAAPAGANGFKQGNFNLSEQEAGRFKGTTKTIVEGEDLDVPTWMRMKKKTGA